MMRRTVAIETSLALLLAFVLAPFQHVRTGHDAGHTHSPEAHSGEIHAHFFTHHEMVHAAGVYIGDDDDDDHAHARSLDTFTLVLPGGPLLYLPSRAPQIAVAPAAIVAPIAAVEERAHDPPCLDRSTPRAPPL